MYYELHNESPKQISELGNSLEDTNPTFLQAVTLSYRCAELTPVVPQLSLYTKAFSMPSFSLSWLRLIREADKLTIFNN
jgi:hypothetical protein